MASSRGPEDEKALESVSELFKTIIETSGIMLALLWGLTQHDITAVVLVAIRVASIVLVLAILGSLIGSQFIVTELERNSRNITKARTVAFSFLGAWLSFLVGCILLIVAIFLLQPQGSAQEAKEKPYSSQQLIEKGEGHATP